MSKHYSVGLELLDQQSDAFLKVLAFQFSELRKRSEKELREMGNAYLIEKEIKSFTNLTVTIHLGDLPPCVNIPTVNKNNILLDDFRKRALKNTTGSKLINEAGGMIRGSVNITTGKVSGIFTEIGHDIYFPVAYLQGDRFTDEECAAIVLHELGHLFSYYLFISNTVTTNQVLEGMAKELSATNNPKEIETVLVNVTKALQLSEMDTKALSKATDKRVINLVVLSNVVEKNKSQFGSDIYDINSFEMLADNFATRFGAGRYLVSALNKIMSFHSSYRSTGKFVFLEAMKITTLIGGIIFAASGVGIGFADLSFIAFIMMTTLDSNSELYDRPGARAQRIRNDVVNQLKLTKNPKEKQALAEDIEYIDQLTKDINDRRQVMSYVGGFFFKNIRNRYKQEKLQQELELLMANDLFLLANELKFGDNK